jgi:hypothetical protein
MTFKASPLQRTDQDRAGSEDHENAATRQRKEVPGSELEPIPPHDLEIARLARSQPGASATEGRGAGPDAAILSVDLHRESLRIVDDAAYFRLKVVLMRTLRKRLQVPVVEVDDADAPPASGGALEITLEPHNSKVLERASVLAERVVRTGRWRKAES